MLPPPKLCLRNLTAVLHVTSHLQGLSWDRLGLGPLPRLVRLTGLTFEMATLSRDAASALMPSLRHLPDLRRLVLDECWEGGLSAADGEVLAHLSGILSGLNSLELLVIRSIGLGLDNFVRMLPGLISLRHLDISSNYIGEDVATIISPVLATMTTLAHLDLSGNSMWENPDEGLIDDNGVATIASALAALTCLLHLDLSDNNNTGLRPLSDAALTVIGNSLPTSLKLLSLDGSGFSASGLVTMAPGLQRLTALENLGLSSYVLGTDSIQARTDSLQALWGCLHCMTALERLDLSLNYFGPSSARHLARCLRHMPAMRSLNLGFNQLGVSGASYLAVCLKHVPGLQSLGLRSNRLFAGGAQHLARCLKHVPALQSLDLGCNQLDVGGARHLAGSLHHMPALRSLDLCSNDFGDDNVAELADGLLALTSLAKIDLRYNKISESVTKILKAAFNGRPGRTPPTIWY